MNNNKTLCELLTICIPTYNRCEYLKKTLEYLYNSPFKDCEIIVLNNASTDDTSELAKTFSDVTFVKNRYNIGYANILRCCEYGTAPYIWIIGDDDEYDFSYVDDIIQVMEERNIGLIHVGAHTDKPWNNGGQTVTPREAMRNGYNFFKYTSFIGCNIIRRDYIDQYIISGYNNLINGYPHMPCLLSFFNNDQPIYISKNQIAKAIVGNQSYNQDKFLKWWGGTSKLLSSRKDQKLCFFDQFNQNHLKMLTAWKFKYINNQISSSTIKACKGFFSGYERILSSLLLPIYFIYTKILK